MLTRRLVLMLMFLLIPLGSAQEGFNAALSGSPETLQAHIDNGVSVDAVDEYGQTLLMYAAEHNTVDAVHVLLNAGADVNARTVASWTPIMYAARNSDPGMVRVLLAAGADPYVRADFGVTPYQVALENGHQAAANELLEGIIAYQLEVARGDWVEVRSGPLRVQSEPRLHADRVGAQEQHAVGKVLIDAPTYADGFWWWQIEFADGMQGWSAQGTSEEIFLSKGMSDGAAAGAGPSASDASLTAVVRESQTDSADSIPGPPLRPAEFFVDARSDYGQELQMVPGEDPPYELIEQRIRGDCCNFIDKETYYWTDGSRFGFQESLISGYCLDVTVGDFEVRGSSVSGNWNIERFFHEDSGNYIFLTPVRLSSRSETYIEYRSTLYESPVLRPATRAIFTADSNIYTLVIDPNDCALSFFAESWITREFIVYWVDLGDRWGLEIYDSPIERFGDYIEIAK